MTIDRLFIAFMTVSAGAATAGVVVLFPGEPRVSHCALFLDTDRHGGIRRYCVRHQPGRTWHRHPIKTRMIGFMFAIVLMLVIPYAAGLPLVRLF